MKNSILLLSFLIFTLTSRGQKYDYNWMAGYRGTVLYDTFYHHYLATSKLNFDQNPISVSLDSLRFNFARSNSIISDKDGNLLFYCNGVRIHNALDELIENGDSLAAKDTSYIYKFSTSEIYYGVLDEQFHLVLPNPMNENVYDLFYIFLDTFKLQSGLALDGKKVLRATLDLTLNNGHGGVTLKDSTILLHENNVSLAANRHGNGRDWWVVTYKTHTNCYSIILYDGSDNITTFEQCAGGQAEQGESMTLRFSPDGSYFATASKIQGLAIFDFDRCNGQIALKEQISIPELIDSLQWWPTSLEFSDDGRFIYLAATYRLFQFDLQAPSIASSKTTVGTYNSSHRCPFTQSFSHLQRAPDGKIYMNGGSTNYCIGVIINPNTQGSACNFNDTAINLPTFIDGLPYYPNYRLGALPGSPCDTLTGLNELAREEKEKILKLYPNPTTNFVTIDYGFTDWNKGGVSLEITNALGQIVFSRELPMYSGLQKIDVHAFANGVYGIYIKRRGLVVAKSMLVKQ